MNKDQVYALNDTLAVFMRDQGLSLSDEAVDAAVWSVVRVIERHEDCPTCGAKAGEPCDPTALEDFDEDEED